MCVEFRRGKIRVEKWSQPLWICSFPVKIQVKQKLNHLYKFQFLNVSLLKQRPVMPCRTKNPDMAQGAICQDAKLYLIACPVVPYALPQSWDTRLIRPPPAEGNINCKFRAVNSRCMWF